MGMEQSLKIERKSKSQQAIFTEAKTQSEAAVKTSYIVVEDVTKAARSFTEGEFVKHCMLKICDAVCPEKRQLFSNVSTTRNAVA